MDQLAQRWHRLISALDAWGGASEVSPGMIEVSLPPRGNAPRTAVVVMSPHDWADMTSASWGGFDDALEKLQAALMTLKPHESYLIWSNHRLVPSRTVELEPDPALQAGSPQDIRGRVNTTWFLCAYLGCLLAVDVAVWGPVGPFFWAVLICCLAGGVALGFLRPWIVPSRHGKRDASIWVIVSGLGLGTALQGLIGDEAMGLLLGGFLAGFIGWGTVSAARISRRSRAATGQA